MENLLIYFVKVNGLIVLFFLMYVLFLRKETFFTSNRWYFLTGLLLSLILPLITFTKTIWVEPTPIPEYYEEAIPITYNTIETPTQAPLDWSLILMSTYFVISILIILKIGIELVSFYRRIQNQNKQKESDYTLVDSNSAENPFSFFSYIVINKDMFTEEELQHILTHESIHVKQKHSFDVLIGKVFCAIFWANPIIWFYRKAMLQNLEFIADNETFQQIENKYEYQKTLLKVVTHQHDLSITNQFYQSLIKKRIVMLHTNQSHKKNVWKYATILPLLVGFMLLFQIETVAQVKEITIKESKAVQIIEVIIDKDATDNFIKNEISILKKDYNIILIVKNIKRNSKNEITTIKINFKDDNGNSGEFEYKDSFGKPIKPIRFYKELDENGEGEIGFGGESIKDKLNWASTMSPNQIQLKDSAIAIKVLKKEIDIENLPNHLNEKQLYIINGKEYTSKELKGKKIETNGTIVHFFKEEAIKKFGEKGKNGVLVFEGKSTISEGDENQVFYKAKEIKSFKPKNIKLNFEKGKQYIISNKKYSFDELKDKDWWLFTGTNHKIEEKDGIVTIIGDVVENASEWNTQDVVEVNTENKQPSKHKLIELENGDDIVLFKDRIKFPGYPTYKIDEILFEFNGNKISDINLFTNENQIKSMDIIENKENQRIIRVIIKTK